MNLRLTLPRLLSGGLLVLALAAPLSAQNRLYALHAGDKNYHAVHKVIRGEPYFLQDGKLVEASGQSLALKSVPEYLPAFIAVHDLTTQPESLPIGDVGTNVNNQLKFSAKFESSFLLDDVFLVLELEFSDKTTTIFIYELGRLKPHVPQPYSVTVPMARFLGGGRCILHLFVAGDEVFHSAQPADYREQKLDEMVARRVAALRDAGPQPFYGIAPACPESLRQSGARGEAVISLRINERGAVVTPAVASASDPAFGEAALAAVRQWRFLPQVKNGHAVEAKVNLPIVYDPAEEVAALKN